MQKAHHSERDLGSLMGKVDVAHAMMGQMIGDLLPVMPEGFVHPQLLAVGHL